MLSHIQTLIFYNFLTFRWSSTNSNQAAYFLVRQEWQIHFQEQRILARWFRVRRNALYLPWQRCLYLWWWNGQGLQYVMRFYNFNGLFNFISIEGRGRTFPGGIPREISKNFQISPGSFLEIVLFKEDKESSTYISFYQRVG